ncbi:MAG: hypothetical protein WCP24_01155 [bacterium]
MDNQNDKTMAIVAYILFFIPLLAVNNKSDFLKFHINQGAILFILAVAGSIILNLIPFYFLPFFFSLSSIWSLACFILFIIGVMNASGGKMSPLPVVGNLFKIV